MIYKNLKNILSFLKPVPIKFLEGFLSWSEAENKIDKGYADERIIQNCKNAATKVLNGEACYERDGVVFQDKSFNDLFLASLILMKKNVSIKILDIGGSLGSLYLQHKSILDDFEELEWTILEQKEFVIEGNKIFTDKRLKFIESLSDLDGSNKFDLIILSSSIQYFEDVEIIIRDIKNINSKIILFLRTPFHEGQNHKIMVQQSQIGIKSAYPLRILSRKKFINSFKEGYEIIVENTSNSEMPFYSNKNTKIIFKNFLLERKDEN